MICVFSSILIPNIHLPAEIGQVTGPQATNVEADHTKTPEIKNPGTDSPELSTSPELLALSPSPKSPALAITPKPLLIPNLTPELNKTPTKQFTSTPIIVQNSPAPLVASSDSSPITSWISEVVDDQKDVGLLSSMAIDKSGISYIAYFDDANDKLRYSFGVTGEWTTQILDNGIRTGFFPSVVLDSHDNPNISYYHYLCTLTELE